jgi:hypothetical protein
MKSIDSSTGTVVVVQVQNKKGRHEAEAAVSQLQTHSTANNN